MTQNDIQKSIFLEQKVLEFNMGDSHKAREVYEIISGLTTDGFELYIIKYFEKLKIHFIHTGKKKTGDGGIDGKGIGVYLQCKKYHRSKDFTVSIGVPFIRDFFGAVMDDYLHSDLYNHGKNIPDSYFVATVNYTKDARDFAKRNKIKLLDYHNIYHMLQIYSLSDFKNSLTQNEREKYFVSSQTSLSKNISPQDITSSDLYFYYREIRKTIAYRKFNNTSSNGFIFDDKNTLKALIENTVTNINDYQEIKKTLPQGEKTKLDRYGKEIERAILLLQN